MKFSLVTITFLASIVAAAPVPSPAKATAGGSTIADLQASFNRNNPNGTPTSAGDPDDLNGDGSTASRWRVFRDTTEKEDETLACLFYNGFLHVWDANYIQALCEPLLDKHIHPSEIRSLDAPRFARVCFYLALIKLTRLVSGSVVVTIPTSTPSDPNPSPSAALLWLPPDARPSFFSLYRSGFLYTMIFQYGLQAIWNLVTFERNLEALNFSVLSPLGYKKQECSFPFLIAADPKHRGKGYGANLLERHIEIHRMEFPNVPVVLDTTTNQAQKVYERIGFRLLGTTAVNTGTDHDGIKVRSGEHAGSFSKRVLILLPQPPGG